MNRALGAMTLLLVAVAVVLGGRTLGSPVGPTPTAAALAAAPPPTLPAATASATAAAPPPTPSPVPPTAVPTTAPASEPTSDTTLGIASGMPKAFQPAPRPAPPPDPGTGIATTVTSGPNDRLQIALTFDAGSDEGYASQILDLLRDEGIKATFGMTGKWAEEHPALIQRMVAEGHQLMNHSYSHQSFTGASTGTPPLSREQVFSELSQTESIIRDLTGYELKPYFRFPYGDFNANTLAWIAEAGYYIDVGWTCDSFGWRGWTGAEVAQRCTTDPLPHEITLLHVGAAAAGDYEGLPALIAFYRGQGYEFVTVEQMLQP